MHLNYLYVFSSAAAAEWKIKPQFDKRKRSTNLTINSKAFTSPAENIKIGNYIVQVCLPYMSK